MCFNVCPLNCVFSLKHPHISDIMTRPLSKTIERTGLFSVHSDRNLWNMTGNKTIVSYHAYLVLYLPYHISSVCSTYTDVSINWGVSEYKIKIIKTLSFLSLVAGIHLHLCKWDKKLASLGCRHDCCELWQHQEAAVQYFRKSECCIQGWEVN